MNEPLRAFEIAATLRELERLRERWGGAIRRQQLWGVIDGTYPHAPILPTIASKNTPTVKAHAIDQLIERFPRYCARTPRSDLARDLIRFVESAFEVFSVSRAGVDGWAAVHNYPAWERMKVVFTQLAGQITIRTVEHSDLGRPKRSGGKRIPEVESAVTQREAWGTLIKQELWTLCQTDGTPSDVRWMKLDLLYGFEYPGGARTWGRLFKRDGFLVASGLTAHEFLDFILLVENDVHGQSRSEKLGAHLEVVKKRYDLDRDLQSVDWEDTNYREARRQGVRLVPPDRSSLELALLDSLIMRKREE